MLADLTPLPLICGYLPAKWMFYSLLTLSDSSRFAKIASIAAIAFATIDDNKKRKNSILSMSYIFNVIIIITKHRLIYILSYLPEYNLIIIMRRMCTWYFHPTKALLFLNDRAMEMEIE